MIHMAKRQIIPAVVAYTGKLAETIFALQSVGAGTKVQTDLLNETTALLEEMQQALKTLEKDEAGVAEYKDMKDKAFYYKDVIMKDMEALRRPADALELIVDRNMWPFPTYADILFEV